MKIERIDHVHVVVKDLDKAASFFSDILGDKFFGPINRSDHQFAFDSAGFELVSLKPGEMPRHLEKGGIEPKEGLFSIALKVPNRDEAASELEAKGMRCVWKGNYPTLKTAQMVSDEYHIWIELIEYDYVPSIALANLGKTSEIPFFEFEKEK